MKTLIKCLKELSEEQLIALMPPGTNSFVSDVSDVDEFSRDSIAKAIALSSSYLFVSDKRKRDILLETISPQTFVNVFGSLFDDGVKVRARHYTALINWASKAENHKHLAKLLGIEDEYIAALASNVRPKTIGSVSPQYPLYTYQKDISDRTFQILDNAQRVLIHLPTGAGKTRTAMNIVIEHLRMSTDNLVLWLADREELCQQAFDEFGKAWGACGVRETTSYGFFSSSPESLGGIDSGFVVAGLHTLNSYRAQDSNKLKLLYDKLRAKVTLVIFDEAHKAVAETYKNVTEDFVNSSEFTSKLIGLTATPGRKFGDNKLDDENQRLAGFFDFNKVSMAVPGYMSPIDYLVSNNYLAKANFTSLNYVNSEVTGFALKDETTSSTLKALSKNNERNKAILETIRREVENGKQVIVFACSVEHSQGLSIALNCMGITSASIDSKLDTPASRRLKIAQYKDRKISVLTNYNVLTAGFDAPQTSVTVIAKPTNSLVEYLQMAGRAMRGARSGGNKECWIYNVNDDIPEFQSVNRAFEYWDNMWTES
ncbi:DEAD/DEAH box helicase [Vibrio owensii]|uniref:DEAD/DEAH box helicase n=2 Tax=Vibrio harveyi group TaxID=717610 RepID=UPI003399874E